MNINKLNYLMQDIYMNEKKAFDKLHDELSTIIEVLSILEYNKVIDKVLYDYDDLIQETLIELFEDLSRNQYLFYTKEQIYSYLVNIINKVIKEINN